MPSNANEAEPGYEIQCGPYKALVSKEDWDYLRQWRWNFKISSGKYYKNVYARRGGGRPHGSSYIYPTILMHVVVCTRAFGPKPDLWHTPHHRNHDTLDNRRSNLEWLSKSEQRQRQRKAPAATRRASSDDPIPF